MKYTRWWKLENQEFRKMFVRVVVEGLKDEEDSWRKESLIVMRVATQSLGVCELGRKLIVARLR